MNGARGKFKGFLASQLYAKSLLVQVLELGDAFGGRLRQEVIGLGTGFGGHEPIVAPYSP